MNDLLDNSIIGDDAPINPSNYKPTPSKSAGKMIQDYMDSEVDEARENEKVSQQMVNMQKSVTEKPVSLPDYEVLIKKMNSGTNLFAVKNTADIPLVRDWDLTLMPEDLVEKFNVFLRDKYIQYGYHSLLNANVRMTSILVDNRTINFIEQFMNQHQIPTIIPTRVGKETPLKSQLVIPSQDAVIVAEKQLESLEPLEKIKKLIPNSKGESIPSSWLGFLIFEPLTADTIRDYKRSIVTYEDIMKSEVNINVKDYIEKTARVRKLPGVIRATE